MLANPETQALIVADARRMMQEWYDKLPDTRGPITHYCLWWADFTVKACRKFGLDAQIQAGDAFWRCVRPEDDDGVEPLNWGYQYEDSLASIAYAAEGFPEMHVWAVVIGKGEADMIDLTAPFFKPRCLEAGQRWTMPDPPEYLWVEVKNFPNERAYYIPNRQAIALCYAILQSSERGGPMVVPIFRK